MKISKRLGGLKKANEIYDNDEEKLLVAVIVLAVVEVVEVVTVRAAIAIEISLRNLLKMNFNGDFLIGKIVTSFHAPWVAVREEKRSWSAETIPNDNIKGAI